jgi:DNA-binding transcriptional LysR family regulator
MRRGRVDLNLLVALDALLTERNVSKAAARLQVGQPAMSASLARLRRVFRDPLLVPSGRFLVLTPLAQSLAKPVEAVLGDIENVLTLTHGFNAAVDVRTFTIMCSDYVTFILLRQLIPAIHSEAPRITIKVQSLTADFQQTIERGESDLVIMPIEFDSDLRRFPHRRLFEDHYVGVVWEGNHEVGDTLTAEEFSQIPHLGNLPGQLGRLRGVRVAPLGVRSNVEIVTQSFVMSPLFVRGTRLLAIVQHKVALELAAVAQARVLALPFETGSITETMYWHPRTHTDPAHRWLRSRIANLAADLLQQSWLSPELCVITRGHLRLA